jgi:hypothetical protein
MPSTGSLATFDLARQWLAACTKHHKCVPGEQFRSKNEVSHFIPTRLVDIGDSGPIRPRIVQRSAFTEKVEYLTLSHCWGQYVPKKLLKQNLTSMERSILLDELSPTFRDALYATRQLGRRYIWIDSLCIIQNSEEDWQSESALMGHIYSDSYCNLAASASRDGSEGLFRERDVRLLRMLKVRAGKTEHNIVDPEIWRREVEGSPLNKRAWVCQERMLAPRNLHFGAKEVFWECNDTAACESYPRGFPSVVKTSTRRWMNEQNVRIPMRITALEDKFHKLDGSVLESSVAGIDAYVVWASIVQSYTQRNLTFDEDKLIAIGGIAERMGRLIKSQYFAGLWRKRFASQLLWSRDEDFLQRPEPPTAPSWSWASVRGPVKCIEDAQWDDTRQDLIKVKNVAVEAETTNQFGRVRGGSVCLEGRLFQLIGHDAPYGFPCKSWNLSISFTTYPDIVYWTPWVHEDLYYLPVKSYTTGGKFTSLDISGLVIETTDRVGIFTRRGTFHGFHEEAIDLINNAQREFDERADTTGLPFRRDDDGTIKYTVTII